MKNRILYDANDEDVFYIARDTVRDLETLGNRMQAHLNQDSLILVKVNDDDRAFELYDKRSLTESELDDLLNDDDVQMIDYTSIEIWRVYDDHDVVFYSVVYYQENPRGRERMLRSSSSVWKIESF